jgi:hypothetical protein
MTAPYDDLARKMAARLERKVDPKLPALVERVLAEGDEDEGDSGHKRSFDPTIAVAIATFVVAIAKAAWEVVKDVREGREKKKQTQQGAAQEARIETLEQEVAFLKGLVLSRVRIAVEAPPEVPTGDRDDIYEAAAEEVVVEEKKRLRIAL